MKKSSIENVIFYAVCSTYLAGRAVSFLNTNNFSELQVLPAI